METSKFFFEYLAKHFPLEAVYVFVAIAGGMARYLNSYANGVPFKLGILLASSFSSGFSGYIFALLAVTMSLPLPMQFIFAGVGGFFGEQTMKYVMEYVTKRFDATSPNQNTNVA